MTILRIAQSEWNIKTDKHFDRAYRFHILTRHQRALLVFSILANLGQAATGCTKRGWFGPNCMYKCRCKVESSCKSNGDCDGPCADDWFGAQCQYRAARIDVQRYTSMADNDPSTCIKEMKPTKFSIKELRQFSWMRLVTKKPEDIDRISIRVTETTRRGSRQLCPRMKRIHIENSTYDFHCRDPYSVGPLAITLAVKGSAEICSLYISQGYNAAVNQMTQLTSQSVIVNARKAVDGDVGVPDDLNDATMGGLEKTCTSLRVGNGVIKFRLHMEKEEKVTLIKLFTGVDLKRRMTNMKDFTLSAFSSDRQQSLTYKPSVSSKIKHHILPGENAIPIQDIVIKANRSLSVCELEVFTELKCEDGYFGLGCKKRCFCRAASLPCFPSNGICEHGCREGHIGRQCSENCREGFHGLNCTQRCSSKCKHGALACKPEYGDCIGGCVQGYAPPFCNYKKCDKEGFFGKDCLFKCHCQHGYEYCDPVTGSCGKSRTRNDLTNQGNCATGYFGPSCQHLLVQAKQKDPAWLYDQSDETCSDDRNVKERVIEFHEAKVMFLRVVTKNENSSKKYTISAVGDSVQTVCGEWNSVLVAKNTRDYACSSPAPVQKIILKGPMLQDLCSVFVSRGRDHALKRQVYMPATVERGWYPTKAVDGFRSGETFGRVVYTDKDTCVRALKEDKEISWTLYLPELRIVDSIYIQNTKDCCQESTNGITIRLNHDDETLYMHHENPTKHWESLEIKFPMIKGKPVNRLIITSRVHSELHFCEVRVYGERFCPTGMFGLLCERKCHCAFSGDLCLSQTGGCLNGCQDRLPGYNCWQSVHEEACDPGFYGPGCKTKCSRECLGGYKLCDRNDGSCHLGCTEGYKPPRCIHGCDPGYFGKSCKTKCSPGCPASDTQECDIFTGACMRPCLPGYLGEDCLTICPPSNYGLGCKQRCHPICAGNGCHHVTGACNDCPAGRTGAHCTEHCSANTYGRNCKFNCSSKCYKRECDREEGLCIKCRPGRKGPLCTQHCEVGSYGFDCAETCSEHCVNGTSQCYPENGTCIFGCLEGKPPPICKDVEWQSDTMSTVLKVFPAILIAAAVLFIFMKRDRKLGQSSENNNERRPEENPLSDKPDSHNRRPEPTASSSWHGQGSFDSLKEVSSQHHDEKNSRSMTPDHILKRSREISSIASESVSLEHSGFT